MAWQCEGCPSKANGSWNADQSVPRWPSLRKLVVTWGRNKLMDWRKFPGDGCGFGQQWSYTGRCMLASSNNWHTTHKPGRTGYSDITVVGQGSAPVHWLSMHTSMADEHPDRKNPSEDESCEWDAGVQKIDQLAVANWGVQSSSWHQTDHIGEEFGWYINQRTKEITWHVETGISHRCVLPWKTG